MVPITSPEEAFPAGLTIRLCQLKTALPLLTGVSTWLPLLRVTPSIVATSIATFLPPPLLAKNAGACLSVSPVMVTPTRVVVAGQSVKLISNALHIVVSPACANCEVQNLPRSTCFAIASPDTVQGEETTLAAILSVESPAQLGVRGKEVMKTIPDSSSKFLPSVFNIILSLAVAGYLY